MDVLRLDTSVIEKPEFPPCRIACPAGINMRGYLAMLKDWDYEKALDLLSESLPFASITGRVCSHPCETDCARKEVDEPVNIRSLERFLGDYMLQGTAKPIKKLYADRVAVVGSGPAGLSAAYFLAKRGYPVTIFEAMPVIGGMLRSGIPNFRLPKTVLDAQIDYVRDMGVEFETGVTIGKDLSLEDLKAKGYPAVFYGVGAQLSKRLEIEGTNLDGVLWGLDFLRDVSNKRNVGVKERVLVIGGGNVAMDVGLTALRLGAGEVHLACLEGMDDMPAYGEGKQQAIEEGIRIHGSWGPKKITGDDGKVSGADLVRCTSVFDDKGEFSPQFDEMETKTIEADMIIFAVGQEINATIIPQGMNRTASGFIQVDAFTLETSVPGVFAGGDVVSGPTTVVNAIASGRSAALSIERYLKGEDLGSAWTQKPRRVIYPPNEGVELTARGMAGALTIQQRFGNFKEIKHGFNEETAVEEAQRCMLCGSKAVICYPDDCMLCDYCELDCPKDAIYVSPVKHGSLALSWG
jgi:NADPH-dependent glutamate synthase beta subunit-like oxidoreductase